MDLPEAKKLAAQMNEELRGKTIDGAHLKNYASLLRMGFINPKPDDLEARLAKKSIDSATAKGKWIFVKLKPEMHLLLGEITGKVLYHNSQDTLSDKYHLRLDFADNTHFTVWISFLGFILVVTDDELKKRKYPGKLGLSPIDDNEFTFQAFNDILEESSTKMIKAVLLNQWKIAGIGNSYLQDILFKAKAHPKRKAVDISKNERMNLYNAIEETLNEAIRLGGREEEYDLYNKAGGYKTILGKHMKGKPCPECGTMIEKLNVLGSSAYVCTSCQK